MIPRYTLPHMDKIWSDKNKFKKWLWVELSVLRERARIGDISWDDYNYIKDNARFDVDRIDEIERETHHDVISFVQSVTENLDERGRFFHQGLTSCDVTDTAFCLLIYESIRLLETSINKLKNVVRNLAVEHKKTVCIGRTHGVHAEPTTFGLKLAVWYQDLVRAHQRLLMAESEIGVGKLSGAVGNNSNYGPSFEDNVMGYLCLESDPVSTQVIQRDRHAFVLTAIAMLGSVLDKFATEIRHLARTEVREVEEPFASGQKGSSAMPHKRNPVKCENVSGLARVLRANALVGLENIPLWHERDISHSSAERVVFADSFNAAYFMLERMRKIIEGMKINKDRMLTNLNSIRGLSFSGRVLTTLLGAGMTREQAYKTVQTHAMGVWGDMDNLQEDHLIMRLENDDEVMKYISREELDRCFYVTEFLKNVDDIFARAID